MNQVRRGRQASAPEFSESDLRAPFFTGSPGRSAAAAGAGWLLVSTLLACGSPPRASTAPAAPTPSATTETTSPAPSPARRSPIPAAARPLPPPSRLPAPARLVAIGDLHGDLAATRQVLRLSGLIDAEDRWIGGEAVLVQVGDEIDRGDDDRAILDLFERLAEQAHAAGGAVYPLLGNHETMNAAGDFRYVTPGSLPPFAELDPGPGSRSGERGRRAAFAPGGPYARLLARRNTILQIGNTVFAHGGVLPEHADEGIEAINAAVRAWLLGEADAPPAVRDPRSPLWVRDYSLDTDAPTCERLGRALGRLGATRMVVAHTVQPGGITQACDGRVWRIDVGMARHYGGRPAALELSRSGPPRVLDGRDTPAAAPAPEPRPMKGAGGG